MKRSEAKRPPKTPRPSHRRERGRRFRSPPALDERFPPRGVEVRAFLGDDVANVADVLAVRRREPGGARLRRLGRSTPRAAAALPAERGSLLPPPLVLVARVFEFRVHPPAAPLRARLPPPLVPPRAAADVAQRPHVPRRVPVRVPVPLGASFPDARERPRLVPGADRGLAPGSGIRIVAAALGLQRGAPGPLRAALPQTGVPHPVLLPGLVHAAGELEVLPRLPRVSADVRRVVPVIGHLEVDVGVVPFAARLPPTRVPVPASFVALGPRHGLALAPAVAEERARLVAARVEVVGAVVVFSPGHLRASLPAPSVRAGGDGAARALGGDGGVERVRARAHVHRRAAQVLLRVRGGEARGWGGGGSAAAAPGSSGSRSTAAPRASAPETSSRARTSSSAGGGQIPSAGPRPASPYARAPATGSRRASRASAATGPRRGRTGPRAARPCPRSAIARDRRARARGARSPPRMNAPPRPR